MPINVNFEHKRVFPGNVGPFAGEMGTFMFWDEPNELYRNTLGRMEAAFAASGYCGYLDVNCIVNGRGIYPLEFTSRFGYPTIQIHLEGITTPAGEWLSQMARGQEFALKTKRGYQIGVRIMVPTYLSHDRAMAQTYHELAIAFKNKGSMEGIHIEDIKDDNGTWRIAGSSGVLLVVTASGQTLDEVRRTVYNRVQNVIIPNMFYRTDIGLRWISDHDKLRTWGYIR
jgi:phosphoribosylamine--glycine ligase